jgi:hypothetical protein
MTVGVSDVARIAAGGSGNNEGRERDGNGSGNECVRCKECG